MYTLIQYNVWLSYYITTWNKYIHPYCTINTKRSETKKIPTISSKWKPPVVEELDSDPTAFTPWDSALELEEPIPQKH